MRRVVQESSDAFLFSDYWSDVSPSCINKTFILCTVGKKKKDFSENASLSELETSETSANVYPKWNEMIQQYKKHFKVEKQSK